MIHVTGRVVAKLGDTLLILDVDEVSVGMSEGVSNVLHLEYDVVTSMLCVNIQFISVCASNIADPVAHRIIDNIKHNVV